MEILIIWIGIAFVTALAAQSRGRSFAGWFFLGFLFSFLALIAVLVMAPATSQPDATTSRDEHVVRTYKGVMIRRAGTGYMAGNRHHDSVSAAEKWIDRTPGLANEIPRQDPAPSRQGETAEPQETLFYRGHPIIEEGDRFLVDDVSYPSLAAAKRAVERLQ